MVTLSRENREKSTSSFMIATGVMRRFIRQFEDGTVLAEVDFNGVNRLSNQPLFDSLPTQEEYEAPREEYDDEGNLLAPSRFKPLPYGTLVVKGITGFADDPDADDLLLPDRTYRFYGTPKTYEDQRTRRTTIQFPFKNQWKVQPHDRAGILRYLMDCPHIGAKTANEIWGKFDVDSVKALRETPEEVAKALSHLPTFSVAKAREASDHLQQLVAMESCTIDLMSIVSKFSFPRSIIRALIKRYGAKCVEEITTNPYGMLEISGCGFKRVDAFAMSVGIDPDSMERQAHAVAHVLESNRSDTWMSLDAVKNEAVDLITGATFRLIDAIKKAKELGLVTVSAPDANKVKWLAERRRASTEKTLANKVVQMLSPEWPHAWPSLTPLVSKTDLYGISDHQKDALIRATRKPIGAFVGGAGTGKSFSVCAFIKHLEKSLGDDAAGSIAVCTLASQASSRLNKDLSKSGCVTRSQTIHSLLKMCRTPRPKDKNGNWKKHDWENNFTFEHDHNNPMECRYLFIDEAFMLDTALLCSLLVAIPFGCQVLLIGDKQQLPAIDPGKPVVDLIAAGVPFGMLTEPQRNAGTIVYACKDIAEGKPFRFDTAETFDIRATPPRNLKMIECKTPAMQQLAVFSEIKWAALRGLDPVWDVQLVIAVNDIGPLCRKKLNILLRNKLNPNGKTVGKYTLRVGDKIICNDNGKYRCADKSAEYADDKGLVKIDNGCVGKVVDITDKTTVVEFFNPSRIVVFTRSKLTRGKGVDSDGIAAANDTGCPLDLNYATTCHSMQGSEAPYVIILIDETFAARMLCSCEWLVTAFSRGKLGSALIGKVETAQAMCRNKAVENRKTFLWEILIEELWGDL